MTFLDITYYNNTLRSWLAAVLIAVVSVFILRVLMNTVVHRLDAFARKTKTNLDDFAVDMFKKTKIFFLFLLSLYAASFVLTLPEAAARIITSITIIAIIIQSAIWGSAFISPWSAEYMKKKIAQDDSSAATISVISFIAKVVLWGIAVLLILDNLGIDITALVAGLGVGGIAVALAVQNILGDLLASLSIVLDKPFVIGDFIIVGDYMGCVEHVGLKTSRIRSLSGEQIIFSNTDLLQSRIRNYKRMFERRVVSSLGVTYETLMEKVEAIPQIIKKAVEAQELARFDRAHFKEYGDFALIFEMVYYVKSPDYNIYMDIQQAINLVVFKRFKEEGIVFAYPTQTLYVNKEPSALSVK
jgi:small-conductance mechanosensitive channel